MKKLFGFVILSLLVSVPAFATIKKCGISVQHGTDKVIDPKEITASTSEIKNCPEKLILNSKMDNKDFTEVVYLTIAGFDKLCFYPASLTEPEAKRQMITCELN